MEMRTRTPEQSLNLSLGCYAVIGGLAAYWGFTFGDWPPAPAMMLVGLGGALMVVTVAPAMNSKTPTTYWVLFVGNVLAGIVGILFEIGLFRRMGLHVALIYPFGLLIFGVVANLPYLLRPQSKALFGITKSKPISDEGVRS